MSDFEDRRKRRKVSNIDFDKLETRLFINNEFVDAKGGKTFDTINPATEDIICSVHEASTEDVDNAVEAAKKAFAVGSPWRNANATDRRNLLLKLADLIERDRAYLEQLESLDNGKPLGLMGNYGSKVDLHLVVECYKYYAGWADKITGSTIPVDGNMLCYTRKEPIGVCACIIPWNFPLLMQAWKLAPALACGNTVVLKSSEKTPLSALHICKLVKEAGFPPGVVNVINGFGAPTGEYLARHQDVDKIAFTGSTAVGHQMIKISAETNLKRVSLELGGKSPLIVFDDADLETALTAAHVGLFLNQGQCCCASSRVFVQEGIYEKFLREAVKKAQDMKLGSFTDGPVEQGPQVDKKQYDSVLNYIEKGKDEGARLLTGGCPSGHKGYFIRPTVFGGVTDDMTIAREEIFGPVLCVLKFKTEEEVIKRANDTIYGLAAGIISRNVQRAMGVANQIQAGTVWINTYDTFDTSCPFGGYKESGHGRDKGQESLDSWLETKAVVIPLQGAHC